MEYLGECLSLNLLSQSQLSPDHWSEEETVMVLSLSLGLFCFYIHINI